MLKARLRVDLSNLQSVRNAIRSGTGPVRNTLDAFERVYRAFIVRRFDVFSMGGGNWKRLKPATARRKGHGKILVDTKFLRLHLRKTIAVVKRDRYTIDIGFKSDVLHPDASLTLEQLAEIHDQGLGNVPRRRILVLPDDDAKVKMRAAAKRIITDALRA